MVIKNERGITLVMLMITVLVMLIIATILINASSGDENILTNAEQIKFKEEMESIKSNVSEKIITKQNIEGKTEGITLTEAEEKEILGKYYENGLLVDEDGNLCRNGEWTDAKKKILDELGIIEAGE